MQIYNYFFKQSEKMIFLFGLPNFAYQMKNNFASRLIEWYNINKRDLPWRKTNDPYKIWVSEIILQQTRVIQGLEYYNRFIERFPTLKKLADAELAEVLKIWQGLGYYSRARNMHQAAKEILLNFGGDFPNQKELILKLKGIGDYTAAAILSFAFNQAYPVIDGNVIRVITRYAGIETSIQKSHTVQKIKTELDLIFDDKNPGIFNQAIMEFGAMVCLPKSPKCQDCIFAKKCFAYKNDKINNIPFKEKSISPQERYFNYFVPVLKRGKIIHTLLFERNKKDIWQRLYEFPLIETSEIVKINENTIKKKFEKKFSLKIKKTLYTSDVIKHKLSHQNINAQFIICEIADNDNLNFSNYFILKNVKSLPVSVLTEQILKKVESLSLK